MPNQALRKVAVDDYKNLLAQVQRAEQHNLQMPFNLDRRLAAVKPARVFKTDPRLTLEPSKPPQLPWPGQAAAKAHVAADAALSAPRQLSAKTLMPDAPWWQR